MSILVLHVILASSSSVNSNLFRSCAVTPLRLFLPLILCNELDSCSLLWVKMVILGYVMNILLPKVPQLLQFVTTSLDKPGKQCFNSV